MGVGDGIGEVLKETCRRDPRDWKVGTGLNVKGRRDGTVCEGTG
jgi:hypothetical protein